MSEGIKNQQFILGLLGGIASVSIIGMIIFGVAFLTSSNNQDNQGAVAGQQEQNNQNNSEGNNLSAVPATVEGVNTFNEKANAEICQEDGLPVVYLFSTTWCSHCQWIGDTFDQTVKKYVDAGKIKAYHWNIDIGDNTLTDEVEASMPNNHMAVYSEFNPQGSIPTFVFGCKYSRIGNGYERTNDLDAEIAEFEALIEDITK